MFWWSGGVGVVVEVIGFFGGWLWRDGGLCGVVFGFCVLGFGIVFKCGVIF